MPGDCIRPEIKQFVAFSSCSKSEHWLFEVCPIKVLRVIKDSAQNIIIKILKKIVLTQPPKNATKIFGWLCKSLQFYDLNNCEKFWDTID